MRTLLLMSLAVVGSMSSEVKRAPAGEAERLAFFENRIRPVLIQHCYDCHSADAAEISGGLALDRPRGLTDGGDSGPAIVAGAPGESLLVEALRYDGLEMPPDGKLPENVIDDFVRWIEAGAYDPRDQSNAREVVPTKGTVDLAAGRQFWAFQPILRQAVPEVRDDSWPVSDIDAFVLARLESAGLGPSPDVDRRTLVRRVYFDLTGLPPTPAQLRRWMADDSQHALERLIDQLLVSKQFGVHWGRHWLDVARYADSNGSDFNATFHNAWRYRDYVIEAINSDKPFDQFVREQIAGDLLPSKTRQQRAEQITATGFLMIGAKMLSERDKEKLAMDVVDEQLNTVGQAFMGLTLGCARCHDHKFDPISTRDYYALAGIFRSTRTLQGESQQYVSTWPRIELPADAQRIAAVRQHEQATERLQARIDQASAKRERLAKQLSAKHSGECATLVDDEAARIVGQWKPSTYFPNFVGNGYLHDDASAKGDKYVEFTVEAPHDGMFDVQLSYTPGDSRARNVPVRVRHADGESTAVVDQRPPPPIHDLYASIGKYRFVKNRSAIITVGTHRTQGHVIVDAMRLVALTDAGTPTQQPAEELAEQLRSAEDRLQEATQAEQRLQSEMAQLTSSAPPPLPRAIAVAEAERIADCQICIRGEHDNLGQKVPRGFLQVIAKPSNCAIPDDASGRLQLADWIASPDHPLTARVIVNRVWGHLFGQAIVPSVDNFGALGRRPSHPALLDRLAAEFIDDGWSVKRLIRRIMLSRSYRMSTRYDATAWAADPDNRLLWRANRRRLPAESIRDGILAISGQLDLAPGGNPVAGLGTLVTQNKPNEKQFQAEESLHRSAYLPMIRGELPTMLTVFDFADPDLVTGRRPVTNVPAQALLLMNSPFVVEQAQLTAARIRSVAGAKASLAELTSAAYELILSREPSAEETDRAVGYLRETESQSADADSLALLVHAMFASTEFRMLD